MKPNRIIPAAALVMLLPSAIPAQRYSVGESVSTDASRTKLVILRDDTAKIEAAIAPARGGELSGFKVFHRGKWIETLYLARDYSLREGWTGKAPFLWPATGRNFPSDLIERRKAGETFDGGAYVWKGKRYKMPIHGFARDLPWKVESSGADAGAARATLSLTDTVHTRELYPFQFHLNVEYVLKDGELAIAYKIRSAEENSEQMFFSLGNHITFVNPLVEGTDPGEVVLTTPSSAELLKTDYGIPTGEKRPRSHADGIKLGEFERRRAVSLTGYRGDEPYLVLSDPQGLSIRLSHTATRIPEQPVILFNVWGDPPAGFMSPEPWVGLQNSLVLRKGLIYLDPGEEYEWTIRLRPESR